MIWLIGVHPGVASITKERVSFVFRSTWGGFYFEVSFPASITHYTRSHAAAGIYTALPYPITPRNPTPYTDTWVRSSDLNAKSSRIQEYNT